MHSIFVSTANVSRRFLRGALLALIGCFDRVYLILPAVDYVAQHLATYREFPPRQEPGSFNLTQVLETLQQNLATN